MPKNVYLVDISYVTAPYCSMQPHLCEFHNADVIFLLAFSCEEK